MTGNYSLESWDERQGLPVGRIWAITQDRAGYLWLGTEAGLLRFDGVRFVRWPENDRSMPEDVIVFTLQSSRDGALWLGFYSGGVGRIRDGRLERYDTATGVGNGPIEFFFEDHAGTMWAGDPDGLYRFNGTRWDKVAAEAGVPAGGVSDAYEDRHGNFWISATHGIFERRQGADRFELVDGVPRDAEFSEDRNGAMWITDSREAFVAVGQHRAPASGSRATVGDTLMHDRDGTLWVGTWGEGLWRVRRDPASSRDVIQRFTVADGLSSNIIRSIFEDRDGNIWVGSESGLHRFTPRKVSPLPDVDSTWSTETTPDGSLWIATTDGLVQINAAGQRRYREEAGLPSRFVRALSTDAHGTLWVGTDRGAARRIGDRFEPVATGNIAISRLISLAADSRGNLWLCDRRQGAFVWSNGRLTAIQPPREVNGGDANFVYVDHRDRVWIGYAGAIVVVTEPGGAQTVHRLGDSVGGVLTSVYEDAKGAIWVGGTRGLGRISGSHVTVVSSQNGLPGYGVFAITQDMSGDLWLGVSSAILRLTESDFEAAAKQARAPLRYRAYDGSDGLVGVPLRGGFPGAVRRNDDTLWFITSRGASVIRPGDLGEGGAQPSVRLETVRAGDRSVALAPNAALDPGTSRILFEYTAVNLTSPMKERFRYRLQGADADWVDAGSRREAFYPNLGSGSYRFEVERITNDQSPGATATWEFTIRPMYYETWWFLCGCLAAAALAAWAAWQFRLRQLRRQFALVFAERARMSRELHDTLLQDLVGISLHFDEIASNLGSSISPVSNQIIKLRRYLQRSIGEARQVVWDLRSPGWDEGGLPTQLRASGERTFAGRRSRFTMTITGTPVRCATSIEQHVLRIAQEALRNAARYADAADVTLVLEYRADSLVLEVVDDGSGFDMSEPAAHATGHYGFLIMRERAEQVGGRFVVESAPGRGTRIEVIVPISDREVAVPKVS